MSAHKCLRIGFLGFGTVGTGVYRMLVDNRAVIESKMGLPFEIVRIGVRDAAKDRGVDPDLVTTDLDAIVDDPGINLVLELIGGMDPAARLVERALRNGKSVVTANKELMAKDGYALVHLARSKGLDLHYEAAVGGGIPLVQPLKHQLAGNDLVKLMGIVNGTTNYILTKMTREGADFAEVLAEAQAKGYAEADPTNDVDGFDAQYKLAILASIAFGRQVPVEGIYREGIRKVTADDIRYAESLGFHIKLLAICEPRDGGARCLARVHPTMLPALHPLANVNDVYNAVWFQGDFVGDVMFSGRGAGSHPTASAVVGDVLDVGRNLSVAGPGSAIPWESALSTVPIEEVESEYYLRIRVKDQPGVLGRVAAILGEHRVSLAAMQMKVVDPEAGQGEIVFLSHRCREADFRRALAEIDRLDVVESVENWIRVESNLGI
ncbi:MAG: homoserine dehydrogenase [Fimbriimonadaceae bacterium]